VPFEDPREAATFEENAQLERAFPSLPAKAKARRAKIARVAGPWTEKAFWSEAVRRTGFE
jgi:hypothetical protein